MKNTKIHPFLLSICLFAILSLSSCEQSFGPASIRVENATEFDFRAVTVRSMGQEVSYGNINSGNSSNYKSLRQAFRSAFVQLSIDDDKFSFQPIDFVGSESLPGGNYTYRVSIANFEQRRLKLEFIRE